MPTEGPAVRREGDALLFSGALVRDAVADTWKQVLPLLDGARRLDLTAATRVDSAGLALLAELAARMDGPTIDGEPEGLGELCAAYRLSPALAYASEQAVG